VKIVGTHLKKLDDRSAPMVYFGIEEGSKAHRMYDPKTNRIVVSRDVVFEEYVKWSWDTAGSEEFAKHRDERDGQFFSGDYSSIDVNVDDAQCAHRVGETGGASSSGEQSASGSNTAEEFSTDSAEENVQTEQNPTTESEPVTP
jgi:hypothetical protein